jgi:hypothetical protein
MMLYSFAVYGSVAISMITVFYIAAKAIKFYKEN